MSKRICVFGEVLFDHFPDGARVLGGAPFNVAWHLQAFGLAPHFVSKVGNDDEGRQVHRAMLDWGMDDSGLQFDRRKPTGRVQVHIEDGEPRYDIVAPTAFDRIIPPERIPDCELFYHGSLALRDPVSRRSAEALLGRQPPLVFVDVNLRSPWWELEQTQAMVDRADWVKLNADELDLLMPEHVPPEVSARQFLDQHRLKGLILTRGAAGAECLTADGERAHVIPTQVAEVVDTVGAGDAFASVILLGLARGWPLETTLERAQAFASALVGRRGATVSEPAFYQAFLDQWQ